MPTIRGQFISKTNIGKVRVVNEDSATSLINANGDVLLVVCDGLGGHNKGDYASQLAVRMATDEFHNQNHFFLFSARFFISRLLRKINREIFKTAEQREIYKDMGTTIVLALLHKQEVYLAYCGDSRAYGVKNGELIQLSEDQTYVEFLYKTGQIKEEEKLTSEHRHELMNALGIYPTISYSIHSFKNEFDGILLCSDGVYNNLNNQQISEIIQTNERLDQKVDTLIAVANSNGGSDNMAISYWEKMKR